MCLSGARAIIQLVIIKAIDQRASESIEAVNADFCRGGAVQAREYTIYSTTVRRNTQTCDVDCSTNMIYRGIRGGINPQQQRTLTMLALT